MFLADAVALVGARFSPYMFFWQASAETEKYTEVRTHQGRWCYGKTPMQTFLDSLPMAREKLIDQQSQPIAVAC